MNEQLYVRCIRLQTEQSLFKAQLVCHCALNRMCVGRVEQLDSQRAPDQQMNDDGARGPLTANGTMPAAPSRRRTLAGTVNFCAVCGV